MKKFERRIAKMAQFAENKYFGKPCGLMDQTACAVGGFITIDFEDPLNPVIRPVDFDFTACGHALCIIDTRASHAELTDEYAAMAVEELNNLRGSEIHSTVILAHADDKQFGKLGTYVTCEPVFEDKKLFHG